MRLYTWMTAPNPRRAKIFVAEKGIGIEIVEAGDPSTPSLAGWYVEKFPHRRVPLLELDDGDWIAEATTICRYLERLHPGEPVLLGRTPREEAEIDMWDRLAEWEGLMAVSEIFRNTHKAFVGRGLSGYDVDIPQIPELAERGKLRLGKFFEKIDRRLADRAFLAGETFSMADITAVCAIDFGMSRRQPIPETCANVLRWHAEVSARPSVSG